MKIYYATKRNLNSKFGAWRKKDGVNMQFSRFPSLSALEEKVNKKSRKGKTKTKTPSQCGSELLCHLKASNRLISSPEKALQLVEPWNMQSAALHQAYFNSLSLPSVPSVSQCFPYWSWGEIEQSRVSKTFHLEITLYQAIPGHMILAAPLSVLSHFWESNLLVTHSVKDLLQALGEKDEQLLPLHFPSP